jgi:hypothetical protein
MIRPILSEGDIAPDCIIPDAGGKEINIRSGSIDGNPIVLFSVHVCLRQVQRANGSSRSGLPSGRVVRANRTLQ